MKSLRRLSLVLLFLGLGAVQAANIQPVPLGSGANSVFRDAQANDRRGGWTDQGSNDLRVIAKGPFDAGGIPFLIADDQAGPACIVLGGKPRDYLPQKSGIVLDAPRSGSTLYLLHGAAWAGADHSIAGRLTVQYADGSEREFRVRVGRDVADWYAAGSPPNAVRAWTQYNNNAQVSLYVSKFKLDAKPVKAIRFSGEEATWMIVAVSLGDDAPVKEVPRLCTIPENYPVPAAADPGALAALPCDGVPRNIILIIGDGMGDGAELAASLYSWGCPDRLVMQQLPVAGKLVTLNSDKNVTDSAAAATALSGGYKTQNGILGLSPDLAPHPTIAELARDSGRSIGIITTDVLVGATPSAYLVHVRNRGMAGEIAAGFAGSGADLLIGSGPQPFLPKAQQGTREDGRNLLAEMKTRGYAEIRSAAELLAPGQGKVFGFIDNWSSDARLLSEVAAAAFKRLNRNPKGFFIMIESAEPDHGGHANDPAMTVFGTLEADFTVQAALEFLRKNPDTLVVVTADHETGGITVEANPDKPRQPRIRYGSANHTGAEVGVFAVGRGAGQFAGVQQNTRVPWIFAGLWRLPGLYEAPAP